MIQIDASQLEAAIKALGKYKEKLPAITAIAINHAIRKGKTEMSRLVRAEFRIKQKDLYSAVEPAIHFANAGSLAGQIGAQWLGMIPTWDFHVAPRGITNPKLGEPGGRKRRRRGGTRQPITAAVRVGGGSEVPNAFVAQMKSGHIGAFRRMPGTRMRKKNKEQIKEMHSISAPFMVSPPPIKDAIERVIQERFDAEFERQVARWASK